MPTNAFVAYYPFDTLDVIPKLSESEKFSLFADKLKAASSNIRWAAGKMGLADYVAFFAVPEYYFMKSYGMEGRDLKVQLYTEQERDALLGRLVTLSDQYNRMVIMPGTISWARKLPAPIAGRKRGAPAQISHHGLSTAPVLWNGDLVHSYEKVMNDGVIDNAVDDAQFQAGSGSPVFTLRNLLCGLEICGDFNEKNLSKATPPQSLDFEFMMSASNFHNFSKGTMDGIPVKNGGYFFHVDQKPSRSAFYNGVWCVSRGSGWHSVDPEGFADTIHDPWSLGLIKRDQYGVERSVGTVLALKNERNYQPTSGIHLPGTQAFAGLKLSGLARPSRALDATAGTYEVTLEVSIQRDSGSQSAINNRKISFKCEGGGTARPTSAYSDGNGKASAVFTCHKDRPARLIAEFHGAKVVIGCKLAWLGPGEVTKISTLKGLPNADVPTFLTPVA